MRAFCMLVPLAVLSRVFAGPLPLKDLSDLSRRYHNDTSLVQEASPTVFTILSGTGSPSQSTGLAALVPAVPNDPLRPEAFNHTALNRTITIPAVPGATNLRTGTADAEGFSTLRFSLVTNNTSTSQTAGAVGSVSDSIVSTVYKSSHQTFSSPTTSTTSALEPGVTVFPLGGDPSTRTFRSLSVSSSGRSTSSSDDDDDETTTLRLTRFSTVFSTTKAILPSTLSTTSSAAVSSSSSNADDETVILRSTRINTLTSTYSLPKTTVYRTETRTRATYITLNPVESSSSTRTTSTSDTRPFPVIMTTYSVGSPLPLPTVLTINPANLFSTITIAPPPTKPTPPGESLVQIIPVTQGNNVDTAGLPERVTVTVVSTVALATKTITTTERVRETGLL